jgi:hypothetical protein
MNTITMPGFTAEASLYNANRRYRSPSSQSGELWSGESIVPAYRPGSATQANCYRCQETAARNLAGCLAIGGISCGSACVLAGPFWGACFAPCMGGVIVGCNVNFLREEGWCALEDCCPKLCGVPNPFDPGSGCCDEGETCVSQDDPNSRRGCCPSDQIVCAGQCCPREYSCCGDTCCPPNYFCRDGFCSEFVGPLFGPKDTSPPKPRGTFRDPRIFALCGVGETPCGAECCPPGLQCCYDVPPYNGVCRTSCGPR